MIGDDAPSPLSPLPQPLDAPRVFEQRVDCCAAAMPLGWVDYDSPDLARGCPYAPSSCWAPMRARARPRPGVPPGSFDVFCAPVATEQPAAECARRVSAGTAWVTRDECCRRVPDEPAEIEMFLESGLRICRKARRALRMAARGTATRASVVAGAPGAAADDDETPSALSWAGAGRGRPRAQDGAQGAQGGARDGPRGVQGAAQGD